MNYAGYFIPFDPTLYTLDIDLSLVNTKKGASNYFTIRGDFRPSNNPQDDFGYRDVFQHMNVSINGTIFGTPGIVQNTDEIESIFLKNGDISPWDASDPDGDYGVMVYALPFSDVDDQFDFKTTILPGEVLTPAKYALTNAGDGNDTVQLWDKGSVYAGSLGDLTFNAGKGNDTVTGGNGDDKINGGDDADTIIGGAGDDTINGASGNDIRLEGGKGDDTIYGDDGNDTLIGIDSGTSGTNDGVNHLNGGVGMDTVQYSGAYDDYVKVLGTSFKDFFKGDYLKLNIVSGDRVDILDDRIESLNFSGAQVTYDQIGGVAGFKWAMETANKLLDYGVQFAEATGADLPPDAKKALGWLKNARQAVALAFEIGSSPNIGRTIFVEIEVGLVRGLQLYVDGEYPGSSAFTGKYFDQLADRVRRDAGTTYDILTHDPTLPSMAEVAVVVREAWREAIEAISPTDVVGDPSDTFTPDIPLVPIQQGTDQNDAPKQLTPPPLGQSGDYQNYYFAKGGNDLVAGSSFPNSR